jgi:mannose-6-phosphate isomerase
MEHQEEYLNSIDKSSFSTQSCARLIPKPWGHETILTAGDAPYTMKIIHINKGCRLSLQVHDKKTESWTVLSGHPAVVIENRQGEMEQIELEPGMGYSTKIGQKHRLIGLDDCDVLESSTPEMGVTLRLEDDYARPNETEAMRAQPNRGWEG